MRINNNRGEINAGTIIWSAIVIGALYAAVFLGPMFYSHQMLIYDVEAEVKQAHRYSAEELHAHLSRSVKSWKLPVKSDQIVIDMSDYDVTITVSYHVDKKILGFYDYRFNFLVEDRGRIASKALF